MISAANQKDLIAMTKTILGSFFISLIIVGNLRAQPATQSRPADAPAGKRTGHDTQM